MGELEERERKRIRNTKIVRAVLTTVCVAVAGGLNPQMLVRGVLKELKTPERKRRAVQSTIIQARKRLIEQGLLEWENDRLRLTKEGKKMLQLFSVKDFKLKVPKRWDKKWRILIFDVREERKILREKIRRTLSSIGFVRLQDSVWIYPYSCEDLITLLKADFKVGKELIYIIADEIENDSWLKEKFCLN